MMTLPQLTMIISTSVCFKAYPEYTQHLRHAFVCFPMTAYMRGVRPMASVVLMFFCVIHVFTWVRSPAAKVLINENTYTKDEHSNQTEWSTIKCSNVEFCWVVCCKTKVIQQIPTDAKRHFRCGQCCSGVYCPCTAENMDGEIHTYTNMKLILYTYSFDYKICLEYVCSVPHTRVLRRE